MLQQEIRRTTGASGARQNDRATGFRAPALWKGFAMLLAAVRRSYWRQVARRRAHLAALELSRFDDARLRDIGVERADIPKLTRGLIVRAHEVGKRSGTAALSRPTPAIAERGIGTRQGQPLGCCG